MKIEKHHWVLITEVISCYSNAFFFITYVRVPLRCTTERNPGHIQTPLCCKFWSHSSRSSILAEFTHAERIPPNTFTREKIVYRFSRRRWRTFQCRTYWNKINKAIAPLNKVMIVSLRRHKLMWRNKTACRSWTRLQTHRNRHLTFRLVHIPKQSRHEWRFSAAHLAHYCHQGTVTNLHRYAVKKRPRLLARVPAHFQKSFSTFVQCFLSIKWSNTITYLHFFNILCVEHNAKNICRTVIGGKEQNLDKQMAKLGISILFQHFIYSIFWPNSTHLQDLENRFHNSILL